MPGYEAAIWFGIAAPAGTPRPIVNTLSREIGAVLARPDVKQRFLAAGVETVGNSPREFAAIIKADMARWEKVLRAADLMTFHDVPIDLGPTRHGVTRGMTIYAFDNSGNRFETFCGGAYSYPDWKPLTWTFDEIGRAVFYHQRSLNEAFLNVYT